MPPEMRLGLLAMQFRGTKNGAKRAEGAAAYEQVVPGLIDSGALEETPAL